MYNFLLNFNLMQYQLASVLLETIEGLSQKIREEFKKNVFTFVLF